MNIIWVVKPEGPKPAWTAQEFEDLDYDKNTNSWILKKKEKNHE
jgi:hypothetical protein